MSPGADGPVRSSRAAELLLATGTVVVFVAALAGAEGLLRHADPHYLDRVQGSTVYSEKYGWRMRPGFEGRLHDVFISVNSRGYRGREHPFEKPLGRTRVLMLGDSVTFGVKVSDGETFSDLLESRSGHFEVVSLAVPGYGTDQELLLLEREGRRYRPDVVILNFCLANDAVNNAGELRKPFFRPEGEGLRLHDEHLRLPPLGRARQWLADESHLYHRLRGLLPGRPAPPSAPEPDAGEFVRMGPRGAAELTFRLIRRLHEVAKGAGARFLVLLHPDEAAFHERSSLLRRFRRAPELEGIAVQDLGERYRALGLTFEQIAVDEQGHLSPAGHRFTAEAIERLLV
jgi:hypothetical protein